ncbi:hypothetical protein [Bacteroides pyogenes]|uniref:hypothetical protein n=1 Tax=Bacteroides pyogenes TaxID=310300 RepID=UPI002FDA37C7
MSFNRTVGSCNLTGVSPLRRSAEALPIACDAFNARTVAIREYHYVFRASSPAMLLSSTALTHRFAASVLVARRFPIGETCHGAPAVWLGAKGTYPICPMLRRRYLASLSLSRCNSGVKATNSGKGDAAFAFTSNLE